MKYVSVFPALKICLVLAMAGTAGACASTDDLEALEAKVTALESKGNQTLQNAAAAKIDSSTALHVATQKK